MSSAHASTASATASYPILQTMGSAGGVDMGPILNVPYWELVPAALASRDERFTFQKQPVTFPRSIYTPPENGRTK